MRIIKQDSRTVLIFRDSYAEYEVKLSPDLDILSVYKQSVPGYWVVSSLDDIDYSGQDLVFKTIKKLKNES